MEKQQNLGNCEESMTTVTMKDYSPGLDYPDPPPSYKTAGGKSTALQITKIIAISGIIITGMISFSIIFSAWITAANHSCTSQDSQQSQTLENVLEPQLLRSALMAAASDLDPAESKTTPKQKEPASDEESLEDDTDDLSEDALTLLKLPLELNLHEYMFDKNSAKSHMNCVVEKKKAEEVVDETAKPLPIFFGNNMSTDPRYLRFTGERMSISCGSPDDSMRSNPPPFHPHVYMNPPHPLPHYPSHQSNHPMQVIGPIPLFTSPQAQGGSFQDLLNEISGNDRNQILPLHYPQNNPHVQRIPTLAVEEIGPIFIPETQSSSQQRLLHGGSSPLAQILNLPHLTPPQLKFNRQHYQEPQGSQNEVPLLLEATQIGERALHQPITIVPRHHATHVIRPRSVGADQQPSRMKRCACDCACKNHGQ